MIRDWSGHGPHVCALPKEVDDPTLRSFNSMFVWEKSTNEVQLVPNNYDIWDVKYDILIYIENLTYMSIIDIFSFGVIDIFLSSLVLDRDQAPNLIGISVMSYLCICDRYKEVNLLYLFMYFCTRRRAVWSFCGAGPW